MVLDSYSLCFRATHCRFVRNTTQTDSITKPAQVCLLMETNTLHEMGLYQILHRQGIDVFCSVFGKNNRRI